MGIGNCLVIHDQLLFMPRLGAAHLLWLESFEAAPPGPLKGTNLQQIPCSSHCMSLAPHSQSTLSKVKYFLLLLLDCMY